MAFISVADEIIKKSKTDIENKFITKYLPILEPASVKVYLFALYLYQSGQTSYTLADLAEKLNISEDDAKNYFEYLEEFELVKVISLSPFEVKILDCENIYGTPKKIKPEKYADFSTEVQAIISGRMISTNEFLEYYCLLEEYGFEHNALLMIISYCVHLKGNDIRLQYIKKVAKSFAEEGVTTAKKVEQKLSAYTSSTPSLIKIFTALSINRQPDIEDDKLYSKWYNDFGFSDDAIIAAAKHFKAKTSEKIDVALAELYKNKKFDVKEIDDYCKTKNSIYNATFDIAKALGVYMQTATPYVENYVTVWANYGFELETLKVIATHCFMHANNSFDGMNDFISSLYNEGIIDIDSVTEKLAEIDADDKLIKNILSNCGLTRKIIAMDRECLKRWKSWNFTDEMLIKAAQLSLGKSNPVAYINTILSSWKNKGIYTIEDIPSKPTDEGDKKAIKKDFKAAQREKDMDVYKRLYEKLKSEEENNG
jgi:DnaD/phage-associated family protein